MLFHDVHRELVSLSKLAERETVLASFKPAGNADELQTRLRTLLADVWQNEWIKCPPKKPSPPAKPKHVQGGHTSLYRLIRQANQQRG